MDEPGGQRPPTFLRRTRAALLHVEELLVALEMSRGDTGTATLQALLRAAVVDADAIGYELFAAFARSLEAVVERLRARALSPDADVIDLLLDAVDLLRRMLARGPEDRALAPEAETHEQRLARLVARRP